MESRTAHRVHSISPSPTLAAAARAAELRASGRDIIDLGLGEPDFETPAHVKEAAKRAIDAGFTKYTAPDGMVDLKRAIAAKLERENGLGYALDQIVVSCGVKHSIFNLIQAVLNPHDEVIIPAPYWASYVDLALLAGGCPVVVPAPMEQGFKLDAQSLGGVVGPRTRLIILNSPSNPTGACYTRTELESLGAALEMHPQVLIASDDIYERIAWTENPFTNIAMACPTLRDRIVVLNGVSKAYAMTGWRIGYAAGPKDIMAAMKIVQSQSTSNPSSIAQMAAIEALTGDQACVDAMAQEFRIRHDLALASLLEMPGVRCLRAAGAFYLFPDVHEALAAMPGCSDSDLAAKLLDSTGVVVVPGSAFGAPHHIRLSFAASREALQEALRRLQSFLTAALHQGSLVS